MAYCHRLIKQTAQGIAGAFYDTAAHDNAWYRQHPSESRFVRAHWQNFIDPARTTLAQMLGMSGYTDDVKAQIHEALLLDHGTPRGGRHRVIDHDQMVRH